MAKRLDRILVVDGRNLDPEVLQTLAEPRQGLQSRPYWQQGTTRFPIV